MSFLVMAALGMVPFVPSLLIPPPAFVVWMDVFEYTF